MFDFLGVAAAGRAGLQCLFADGRSFAAAALRGVEGRSAAALGLGDADFGGGLRA